MKQETLLEQAKILIDTANDNSESIIVEENLKQAKELIDGVIKRVTDKDCAETYHSVIRFFGDEINFYKLNDYPYVFQSEFFTRYIENGSKVKMSAKKGKIIIERID